LVELDVRHNDPKNPVDREVDRRAFDGDVVFEAAGDPDAWQILIEQYSQPVAWCHVRP
jgi:hypothetical protein